MLYITTETPVNDEPVSVEEWCSCNECEEMPSSEECMCCRSLEYVQPNIDELECITEHPQFQLLILNPDVLTVAFIQIMMYKRQPGYVSYQQLVLITHIFLLVLYTSQHVQYVS